MRGLVFYEGTPLQELRASRIRWPGHHRPCKRPAVFQPWSDTQLACLGRLLFLVSLRDPPLLAGAFFAGVPLLPDPPSDRLGGIAAEQPSGTR